MRKRSAARRAYVLRRANCSQRTLIRLALREVIEELSEPEAMFRVFDLAQWRGRPQ